MRASQGGTIASRFIRFNPRKVALDKINAKWGTNIELEYYDGLPTTIEDIDSMDSKNEEEEVVINE